MPVVSIIVPVYNVEPYLEFCVDSLRKQTLKDIEIILVDDGSPDKSGEMCDQLALLDSRISVIHKENGGLSSARNAGIAVAKGDYIGFVDSDDWVEPDMFACLYRMITQYDADIADCEMIETAKREFLDVGSADNVQFLDKKATLDVFFRVSNAKLNYCVCDKLYKRSLLEDTRFTEGIIFEDIDFNYRILIKANNMVTTDAVKYYYFENYQGISRNSFRVKDLELLAVWDNIIDLSKTHTPDHTKWAVFNRQRADFGLLCKMFKYGCREDSPEYVQIRKTLLKSVRKNFIPLLKGPLPFNRKILLVMMSINYRLVDIPLKIRRKLLRR